MRLHHFRKRCICIDMVDWNITPAELSAALDCPLSTVRAWHNRVGLLPRDEKGGWRRYSSDEAITIGIVKRLTDRGLTAQTAVEIAHDLHSQHRGIIEEGVNTLVGISKIEIEDEYQWRRLDSGKPIWQELEDHVIEVMIVLNLTPIAITLLMKINRLRGVDEMTNLSFDMEPIPDAENEGE